MYWEQGQQSRLEKNEEKNLKAGFWKKKNAEESKPMYLNGLKRVCLLVQQRQESGGESHWGCQDEEFGFNMVDTGALFPKGP